jgi:cell division septum initiation protein DivIVA
VEALRLEIEELAEKDTDFRQQLAELLKEIAAASGSVVSTQTSTTIGDNNKIGQATGKDISIHIG